MAYSNTVRFFLTKSVKNHSKVPLATELVATLIYVKRTKKTPGYATYLDRVVPDTTKVMAYT